MTAPTERHHRPTTPDPDNDPRTHTRLHALRTAIGQLAAPEHGLLAQLHSLIAEPTQNADQGTTGHHKVTGSPAPWNTEVAGVYMDIHAGARDLEDTLRARLGFARRYAGKAAPGRQRPGPRGATHQNTVLALLAIHDLANAAGPSAVKNALAAVESWVTAAQQVRDIDTAERWVPVPRLPGHRPAACPYCATYALRMQVRAGRVICTNHACRDPDGRRPLATVVVGLVSGTAYLEFADGARVTYAPSTEEAQE